MELHVNVDTEKDSNKFDHNDYKLEQFEIRNYCGKQSLIYLCIHTLI